jgi:hypothetical protein
LTAIGADHRSKQVGRALAFTAWLGEIEMTLPGPLGRAVRAVSSWMQDRLPDEAADIDWSEDAQLLVAPTGSLAHVYFTDRAEPVPIEQIETQHHKMLTAVVAHPSIAAVAARTAAGGVEIRSARGTLQIGPGRERRLIGEHPLSQFMEGAELEAEVERLAKMPHSGDLVLFSARDPHGRVVNFQVEMGSHGGLHLEEQSGFVLAPPHIDFDFSQVRSARDLYRLFARYHEAASAERAVG